MSAKRIKKVPVGIYQWFSTRGEFGPAAPPPREYVAMSGDMFLVVTNVCVWWGVGGGLAYLHLLGRGQEGC